MKVISRLNSPKCTFFKLFSHIFRGNLFEGSSIKKFESNLGKYIGVKHVSSVSSARYGLYIIMKSLNINKGKDEIIMPSYMPPIVGLIAKLCGLKIVFADINPNTYNIDPAEIEKKITKNTKILLIVHLYGVPCDMDKIMKIVKKHNIFLIEDAAQALGASYKGKKVGSFGDASVVSFGYCKNINTLCGGVVLTNNDLLNNKIKNELKQLPLPKRITLIKRAFSSQSKRLFTNPYIFTFLAYPFIRFLLAAKITNINRISKIGFKGKKHFIKIKNINEKQFIKEYGVKFTNFQAKIGLEQLVTYDKIIKNQNKNAFFIKSNINNYLPLPNYISPAYFLCVVQVDNCADILIKLLKSGIIAGTGHYRVLPDMDFFKEFKCECPVARSYSNRIIYLPFKEHINEKHLKIIIKVINNNSKEFNIKKSHALYEEYHKC